MSTPLPPDVLFAQKASAVVKAAGFDPRTMDLESFRKMAPEIFVRACQAIYKQKFNNVVEPSTSPEERESNCQIIIEWLIEKTRNPVLNDLTGDAVVRGSHRAIGILVGVIFAEGQRMWLEKHQELASPEKSAVTQEQIEMKNEITDLQHRARNMRENSGGVQMEAIDGLIDRIRFLEDKLAKTTGKPSKISKRQSAQNYYESPTRPETFQDDLNFLSEMDRERVEYHRKSDHEDTKAKRKRPSSAPSARVRQQQVTERLYNAGLAHLLAARKHDNEADDAAGNAGAGEGNSPTATQQQRPSSPRKDVFDPNFTYDMKSGRRIPVEVAEMMKKEEKRRLEAAAAAAARPPSAGNARRVRPTCGGAAILDPRFEKSLEEWVAKTRQEREERERREKGLKPINPSATQPRVYGAYHKLETKDFLISVEHCHDCEHHDISLRHKSEEYATHADGTLRSLAQIVHDCNLCVRLGVVRLRAKIDLKPGEPETESRIGAFEVQVAYKSATGKLEVERLHSKLVSTRWPSKTVVEKRLRSFISKCRIPEYQPDETSDYADSVVDCGISSYPVGKGPWLSTSIGMLTSPTLPFAEFTSQPAKSSKLLRGVPRRNHHNDAAVQNISSVMWVYDSKLIPEVNAHGKAALKGNLPSLGDSVRVTEVITPRGGKERHSLLGTMKGYGDQDGEIRVLLRYCNEGSEISVPMGNCVLVARATEVVVDTHRTPRYIDGTLPQELEALFLLAAELQRAGITVYPSGRKWLILNSQDVQSAPDDVMLCRTSFFHQIRSLVAEVEANQYSLDCFAENENGPKIHNANNPSVSYILHPVSGNHIDLQMAYSEDCLDWVFGHNHGMRYSGLADMNELETRALESFSIHKGIPLQPEHCIIPPFDEECPCRCRPMFIVPVLAKFQELSRRHSLPNFAGKEVRDIREEANVLLYALRHLLQEADTIMEQNDRRHQSHRYPTADFYNVHHADGVEYRYLRVILRELDPQRNGFLDREALTQMLLLLDLMKYCTPEIFLVIWRTLCTNGTLFVGFGDFVNFLNRFRGPVAASPSEGKEVSDDVIRKGISAGHNELGSMWLLLRDALNPGGAAALIDEYKAANMEMKELVMFATSLFQEICIDPPEGIAKGLGCEVYMDADLFLGVADDFGLLSVLTTQELDMLIASFPLPDFSAMAASSSPRASGERKRCLHIVNFLVWFFGLTHPKQIDRLLITAISAALGDSGSDGVDAFLSLASRSTSSGVILERDLLTLCEKLDLKFSKVEIRAFFKLHWSPGNKLGASADRMAMKDFMSVIRDFAKTGNRSTRAPQNNGGSQTPSMSPRSTQSSNAANERGRLSFQADGKPALPSTFELPNWSNIVKSPDAKSDYKGSPRSEKMSPRSSRSPRNMDRTKSIDDDDKELRLSTRFDDSLPKGMSFLAAMGSMNDMNGVLDASMSSPQRDDSAQLESCIDPDESIEKQTLKRLFTEMGGKSWKPSVNWFSEKSMEFWDGVAIAPGEDSSDESNLFVSHLNLSNRGACGSIPVDLEYFSKLVSLDFSRNSITGSLGLHICRISSLTRLNLSHNNLSGWIPSNIGELRSLEFLDLSFNHFSGKVPSEVEQLNSLSYLYLQSNDLVGPFFVDLKKLPKLVDVQYDEYPYSDFEKIPHWLLAISHHLDSTPPTVPSIKAEQEKEALLNIFNSIDRYSLALAAGDDDNEDEDEGYPVSASAKGADTKKKSSGKVELPEYSKLWYNWGSDHSPSSWRGVHLTRNCFVDSLVLMSCGMTNAIPVDVFSLTSLRFLDLSCNALTGEIPSDISKLHALAQLFLNGNKLTGSVNLIFCLSALEVVDLSNNLFSGELTPPRGASLTSLRELKLSGNVITGTLANIGGMRNLTRLELSDNNLNDWSLPQDIFPDLEILDLSRNSIASEVVDCAKCSSKLRRLDISHNIFRGTAEQAARLFTTPGVLICDQAFLDD